MMEKTHEKECMSVYQSSHMREHMDLGLPAALEYTTHRGHFQLSVSENSCNSQLVLYLCNNTE